MKLEYLGKIGYKQGKKMQAYFVGIEGGLEYVKNLGKRVILFGCGENGFYAESLLRQNGIEINGYVDNSEKIQGDFLRGKPIQSPFQLFDDDKVYFIISVDISNINRIRLQLMANGIKDYGIFLNTKSCDFGEDSLQSQVLEAVNDLCFSGESIEEALPYTEVDRFENALGIVNRMLMSTEWSGWIYLWQRNLLRKIKEKNILEIGPGWGLMSNVLLKEFPSAKIDWVLFGDENDTLDQAKFVRYERCLKKIKAKYPSQIRAFYGKIEYGTPELECEAYDLIIMTEVFEHFATNPVTVMKRIANALKAEGYFLFTTPNWGPLHIFESWEHLPEANEIDDAKYMTLVRNGHSYQYSREELEEVFSRSGLKIVEYKLSGSNNHNIILKKEDACTKE